MNFERLLNYRLGFLLLLTLDATFFYSLHPNTPVDLNFILLFLTKFHLEYTDSPSR